MATSRSSQQSSKPDTMCERCGRTISRGGARAVLKSLRDMRCRFLGQREHCCHRLTLYFPSLRHCRLHLRQLVAPCPVTGGRADEEGRSVLVIAARRWNKAI